MIRPVRAYKRPQIVECHLEKFPKYRGKWLPSEKKSKYPSRNIRSSAARTIENADIEHRLIGYGIEVCSYVLNDSQVIS